MTKRMIKAKVRAGILIPLKQLDEYEVEKLQNENTWHNYLDPYACRMCPDDSEKPTNCGNCEHYEMHRFYQRKLVKGEPVIVINKGYRRRLEKFFDGELKVLDRQSDYPMSTDKYRFDYSMLNDGQKAAHDDLVELIGNGYSGILKSPARTGKTVMAASVVMTLNRRTIFIAHQEDLLTGKGQLLTTFTGKTGATAPVNPNRYFTNLHKFLEKNNVNAPIKYCRTLEDFLTSDICLTTYQVFLHPRGMKILAEIKDKFGLLVVDECFPEYVEVLLSDGKKQHIKDVVERCNSGEELYVKSKNLVTGAVEDKKVISTNIKPVGDSKLIRLHYPGGFIDCTDNHPIWSYTRNEYIRADDIQEGEDVEIYEMISRKE